MNSVTRSINYQHGGCYVLQDTDRTAWLYIRLRRLNHEVSNFAWISRVRTGRRTELTSCAPDRCNRLEPGLRGRCSGMAVWQSLLEWRVRHEEKRN